VLILSDKVLALGRLEDSSRLLEDADALRARARRDGYLFFRGLLDPEPILSLRVAIIGVLGRYGLRAEAVDPQSGKLDLERVEQLSAADAAAGNGYVPAEIYVDLQKLPELHRLPHHPSLTAVFSTLFGEQVFVHPRHIVRAALPHSAYVPVPAHQDFPLVQGSADTWTCWFPVGDCPTELGPLAILRGSHADGHMLGDYSMGTYPTGWGTQLCDGDTDWLTADFAIGDVLTFPCYTVHCGTRPEVPDEVRISLDVRYQRVSDPIEQNSLENHSGRPWADIYAGWPEQYADLRYYWQADAPVVTPWNASLMEPGTRRIC
jgi:hypothetical protein